MTEKPMSGLYKIDPDDPSASLEPGKVSEMILDFAHPLLELEPAASPSVDALRNILMLAEFCWNLHVYERAQSDKYPEFQAGLQRMLAQAPTVVADRLRQLIEDRKSRFGAIPFLITARVESEGTDRARVVAEARMLGPSAPVPKSVPQRGLPLR